jgi:RNA-directed DNA polymerase
MSLAQQMARALQLPEAYISAVATSASYRYKVFTIKKADGKSNRTIEQPSKELKLLQRWLVRRVFDLLPTHACAHAYVRGRNIRTNASIHQKSRYVSRLDLENFFPSLTAADVELLFKRNRTLIGGSPLTEEDVRLICALTCRFGKLTIGAPSSPTLSNKLLYELDVLLARISTNYEANYTRYADDLYFSSSRPGVLYEVCKSAERAFVETASPGLRINQKKTYHASRKKRIAVTGLRITPEGNLSVGRDLKRRIRVFAHKASKNAIAEKDLGWLRGMLAYVSSIEPQFAERIRDMYGIS